MITPDEMVEILLRRNFILRHAADGWHAFTPKSGSNTEGRLHRDGMPTPMEAVEAAEATMVETEQRRDEEVAAVAISRLQTARYYLRPRIAQLPDPDTGEPRDVTVFDAFRAVLNTRITEVQPRQNYLLMIRDVEAHLAAQ